MLYDSARHLPVITAAALLLLLLHGAAASAAVLLLLLCFHLARDRRNKTTRELQDKIDRL